MLNSELGVVKMTTFGCIFPNMASGTCSSTGGSKCSMLLTIIIPNQVVLAFHILGFHIPDLGSHLLFTLLLSSQDRETYTSTHDSRSKSTRRWSASAIEPGVR